MKKLLPIALASVFALMFFIEPASAQLIDINENPSAIVSATSHGGSSQAMTLKYVNFALYFFGLFLVPSVLIGFLVGIAMVCFKSSRKAGKKVLIFSAIGLFLIALILVGFALVNTFMSAGMSTTQSLI